MGPPRAVDPSRYFEIVATSLASNAWTVSASRLPSLAGALLQHKPAAKIAEPEADLTDDSRFAPRTCLQAGVGRASWQGLRWHCPAMHRLDLPASLTASRASSRCTLRFCTADPSKTLCNLPTCKASFHTHALLLLRWFAIAQARPHTRY